MFRAAHELFHTCSRPTLMATCLTVSLQAMAADSVMLNLPAQSLATSLSEVAQKTHIQLLFDEEQLRNTQARALEGRFTAQQAVTLLLGNGGFKLIRVGNTFVVRKIEIEIEPEAAPRNSAIQLGAVSILGDGKEVSASTVGRSTLTQDDIERNQPSNIPALLGTLPGVSMGGSMKPGGQTINIWGLGDAEDVPLTVDGATKSSFERYQQGTIFIEPELIKSIEVEKGPHSPQTGNGGFGGTVHMETKDAPDLLEKGRNSGAMVKYGYASNNHEQTYSATAYGRTDDGRADALVFLTQRDGGDMKLAATPPDPDNRYPINPKRLPNSAQDLDAMLLKLNLNITDEQSLKLSYSRSHSERWAPFSSQSYPTPPSASNIARYGYEGALKRLLADRDTVDTTWSGKYQYKPSDNPWVDLQVKYSESNTDQTDERDATAYYQLSTGGRKMDTAYKDRELEIKNTSLFDTGVLQHALTAGVQIRRHARETEMWMPGTAYETPMYNYGHFQPAFMPHGKVDANAFFIEDAVTLGDFTLTPSLRYDHVRNRGEANEAPYYSNPDPAIGHDYSDRTYAGWSPRLAAFWRVTPTQGLFANYSKTWRAPVIDEQYEVQGLGSRTATSVDLDPERITALRLGTISHFSKLLSGNDDLMVRSTFLHNRIEDEIFKATGVGCENQAINGGTLGNACPSGAMSNYRNIGGMTIKGFEVESYYDSDHVFGQLSYTYLTGKRDNPYTNPWGSSVWARDIPPAKWVVMLGTKIPSLDARVGWQGIYVRKTDRLPSDKYSSGPGSNFGDTFYDQYANDSYVVQSLFAQWKPRQRYLKGTEINVMVDNLMNRNYRPELSGDRAYSEGRNLKVSLTRFF